MVHYSPLPGDDAGDSPIPDTSPLNPIGGGNGGRNANSQLSPWKLLIGLVCLLLLLLWIIARLFGGECFDPCDCCTTSSSITFTTLSNTTAIPTTVDGSSADGTITDGTVIPTEFIQATTTRQNPFEEKDELVNTSTKYTHETMRPHHVLPNPRR